MDVLLDLLVWAVLAVITVVVVRMWASGGLTRKSTWRCGAPLLLLVVGALALLTTEDLNHYLAQSNGADIRRPDAHSADDTPAAPLPESARPDEAQSPLHDRYGDCLALGIVDPDHCYDYEVIYNALEHAPLAYNRPETMIRGRRVEISLVIDARDAPAPKSELQGLEGPVVEDTTKVSFNMSARLRGSSFDVEPEGLQGKIVTPVAPTVWTWFVTPREVGSNRLMILDVYAHIQSPDGLGEPFLLRTYRDRIAIDVSTWDYLVSAVDALEPVHGFAVALFGTVSAVVAFAWGWFRRRAEPVADGKRSKTRRTNRRRRP